MICRAEGAAAAARRAVSAQRGERAAKGDGRFEPRVLAALSRIFAREAALEVANGAMRWVLGADGVASGELPGFVEALGLQEIHAAQTGLVRDMDEVADALYGRV
jgi:alkylation response protein AidB-like acyl-CoA dehydrogenase